MGCGAMPLPGGGSYPIYRLAIIAGSGFLPSVFQGVQCRSKGDPAGDHGQHEQPQPPFEDVERRAFLVTLAKSISRSGHVVKISEGIKVRVSVSVVLHSSIIRIKSAFAQSHTNKSSVVEKRSPRAVLTS